MNPVGELFADPITTPLTIPGIRFLQYENDWDFNTLIARNNIVNSAEFKGIGADYLLLTVEEQNHVYKNGHLVHAIKYAIRYHPKTWREPRLRLGTFHWNNTTDKGPRVFRDDHQNILSFGYLNADGTKKANQVPTSADFDEFDKFTAVDFNDFLRI